MFKTSPMPIPGTGRGVSFSTVNRWENGRSVPKLCKLKLINQFCIERDIPFDVEKFMIKFESDIAGMK